MYDSCMLKIIPFCFKQIYVRSWSSLFIQIEPIKAKRSFANKVQIFLFHIDEIRFFFIFVSLRRIFSCVPFCRSSFFKQLNSWTSKIRWWPSKIRCLSGVLSHFVCFEILRVWISAQFSENLACKCLELEKLAIKLFMAVLALKIKASYISGPNFQLMYSIYPEIIDSSRKSTVVKLWGSTLWESVCSLVRWRV